MSEHPRVRLIYQGKDKDVYALGQITVRIGRDGVWLCLTCGYGKNLDCQHVREVRAWVEQQNMQGASAA